MAMIDPLYLRAGDKFIYEGKTYTAKEAYSPRGADWAVVKTVEGPKLELNYRTKVKLVATAKDSNRRSRLHRALDAVLDRR